MASSTDADSINVRNRLEKARQDVELVSIRRAVSSDALSGYILGIGTAWVLIALLDAESIRIDSFSALRTQDILEIATAGGDRFVRRALELQGQWPPPKPPVAFVLDNAATIISSGGGAFPLVTVHPEVDDPDICFIGMPVSCKDNALELLEIGPQAEWDTETTSRPLNDVTRIDFGGRYEKLLYEVGGTPSH